MALHEFLRGHTLADLSREPLHIEIRRHPCLPIAILNYNQIKSPKDNPVVRECRQKIIEIEPPYRVVSRSFDRFFNYGESGADTDLLHANWKDAVFQEKHDGSLIAVFSYSGQTIIATRGSFGNSVIEPSHPNSPTWEQAVRRFVDPDKLDLRRTYVFELCTKYNRVVREYPEDALFLLTIVDPRTGEEATEAEQAALSLPRPRVFAIPAVEQLRAVIEAEGKLTPGFEGLVAKIPHGNNQFTRIKIKDAAYLELHHKMTGTVSWATLVSVVIRNEVDEVLTMGKHRAWKDDLVRIQRAWAVMRVDIQNSWNRYRVCVTPKELALMMKADNCAYHGMIFDLFRTTRDCVEIPNDFFLSKLDVLGKLLAQACRK